ncbi:polysaccharide pyruvyl transferase family protein [Methylopila musalis]|uniref:Polysaccharide pyruvyl transferase family protein n=1 Tax=Methylopila musalis TaxID=1134781 RepID=A0ABW3Z2W7_9HYPH
MKFGVMTFGYGASLSQREKFDRNGFISVNLGDFVQTIAAREAFRAFGIPDAEVIEVDRDALATYDGEPVRLVMNGCFFDWCFPIAPAITPVFIGFQARREVIRKHLAELKRHEPIGCRDDATAAALTRLGVKAFVSGCLTLTLAPREQTPTEPRTFVVYGDGAGAFPNEVLGLMPPEMLASVEFVHQRKLIHAFPLSALDRRHAEDHARHLLADYRRRATRVVTSLHHAAAPCAAMGAPVIICRSSDNSRFSTLRQLMPYFVAGDFAGIDWDCAPIDLTGHRTKALNMLSKALLL